MCTEIYGGPDVATITGDIDGAPVDTTVDRANGCGIDDWDTVLAGLLPPAVGGELKASVRPVGGVPAPPPAGRCQRSDGSAVSR